MLCELFIQNLAVIEKTSIQFNSGLNVFTGETGAGKSIVIDAINAILGQRTSKEIVRHGENKASITARFSGISPKLNAILAEYGYESENDEVIVSREIFADAKSSARIMGKPVTVGILKEIGAFLINIHGQHDNQILLAVDKHIDILDSYGGYETLYNEYFECYKSVVQIKREMKKISIDEDEKARKIDLLSFQIDEIEAIEPIEGEEEELLKKRNESKNYVKIIENLSLARNAISGDEGDGGAYDMAQLATSALEKASEFSEEAGEFYAKADSVTIELSALLDSITSMMDDIDFNPQHLEDIEDRLNDLQNLRKKYGNSVEEINEYLKNAKEELNGLTISEQRLNELNLLGQKEYERLLTIGEKLTKCRNDAAKRFVKTVSSELAFLDMPNVCIEIKIDGVKPNIKGMDSVEFLISTNKGEPPKPIAKIASGGELSRIMLAIKNTLADKDEIPTLIFDEVDTGVSGHAAQKIGQKLHSVAQNRQILAVTHLAQIAALADHHFLIKKSSDDKKTYTNVSELDYDGRVNEVARIMSTDKISDLMLQSAREMIDNSKKQAEN